MPPTASFTWKMGPRAISWHNAWDDRAARYRADYVNPTSWRVMLNGRLSKSGAERISSYTWTLRGLDDPGFQPAPVMVKESKVPGRPKKPPTNIPSHKVDIVLDDDALLAGKFIPPKPEAEFVVPSLGRYRVTLKVTNDRKQSATATQDITLRDLLVVSLGDSLASGEGNPDIPGQQDTLDVLIDLPDIVDEDRDAIWTDRRCHRSIRNGHALAAQAIEAADPHRSVTFLSFACSGARTGSGLLGPYGGMEPPSGAAKLPAQLEALDQAIGDTRPVDILLLTAGINDLGIGSSGFASIISAFADPRADLVKDARRAVTAKLPLLSDKYNLLAYALSSAFNGRVGQVYFTGYPADIFHDDDGDHDGCGLLFDIDEDEATFLAEKGTEFNAIIEATARQHGWQFVGGLTEKFDGHGYCCDDPWYVGLRESVVEQLNIDGTIHPNRHGHRAIGEQIAAVAARTRPAQRQPQEVRVTFSKLKLVDRLREDDLGVPAPAPDPVPVTLWLNGRGVQTDPLPTGREIDLPENEFRLSAIVANGLANIAEVRALAVLRPRTVESSKPEADPQAGRSVSVRRTLQARALFTAGDRYGEGTHTTRASLTDASLEVTYSISLRTPGTVKPGSQVAELFKDIQVVLDMPEEKEP